MMKQEGKLMSGLFRFGQMFWCHKFTNKLQKELCAIIRLSQ